MLESASRRRRLSRKRPSRSSLTYQTTGDDGACASAREAHSDASNPATTITGPRSWSLAHRFIPENCKPQGIFARLIGSFEVIENAGDYPPLQGVGSAQH